MCYISAVYVAVLLNLCWAVPRGDKSSDTLHNSPSANDLTNATSYLEKYGYLNGNVDSRLGRSRNSLSLRDSIKMFQNMAQLNVTGEIDADTLRMMRVPRCGLTDYPDSTNLPQRRRRKRYVLQGSRWTVRNLRYKIVSWPTSVSNKDKVRQVISQSFRVWSDHSELTFTEVGVDDRAQIEIRFESREHGDMNPFDGEGGTLAHAYFPIFGGDVHFDDEEIWSISLNDIRGIHLFMTAAHEFGHSLGLSHSSKNTLMGPFYKSPPADGSLNVMTEDDIQAIQALYGPPITSTTTQRPTSTNPSSIKPVTGDEVLCADPNVNIDAIFTAGLQGQTYVFIGALYWRLNDVSVAEGYPKKIKDFWGGLPNDIDAAIAWNRSLIFFFKDEKYWRMTNFSMDSGYPKLIKEGFPGIPDKIDAAFRWSANGALYFFRGSQYWRYDVTRTVPVSHKYPQPISNWRGVPNDLDAAFTYSNGKTYFFKDGSYFRFNDLKFMVDVGTPSYPRPVGPWWFGCAN